MRTKTEFYRIFFEQLARRGFQPRHTESFDYIADIYHKGHLIAYYTKADTIQLCTQTQLIMKDRQFSKLMNLIEDTASASALNSITPTRMSSLFGYVFSTYFQNPSSNPENHRIFYSREFTGQDFAICSGLVDEKSLFNDTELRVIHSNLMNTNILDNNISNDELPEIRINAHTSILCVK
ncbi:MAG: hypothetical protein HFE63_01625 [Clostridiales bacterium]|nr:hypothetical protein [Clostridiales bacterium]